MARLISGSSGGRRLATPAGRGTRPTSDRVREGLFSSLDSLAGGLAGSSFLDLYAGSGAVGLEAASRGAGPVVLVEREPKAAQVIRANLQALAISGVEVVATSVERYLAGAAQPFDVVFLDPPYADPVDTVLAWLVRDGWLAASAAVCVERATRGEPLAWPEGLGAVRSRRYGDTTLWYGRAS
ncbi:MAG TPA: 16S rRNA (guanine(966)-N(2))-methyltransferase RsmD [Mycobacteriales bacterium]|nr:16S rRNA (guanine(966)-N(2))-methyltransferase RsmD [Mycobacteriales bacterium]